MDVPGFVEISDAKRVERGLPMLAIIRREDGAARYAADNAHVAEQTAPVDVVHLVQAVQRAKRKRGRTRAAAGKRQHHHVAIEFEVAACKVGVR